MSENRVKRKEWTLPELKEKINEIGKGNYEYVGGFTSITKHIRIKHKECGYEYEILPYNFFKGRACPLCRNRVVVSGINDLATTHPQLMIEWDYEGNEIKPTEVSYGSGKKVSWICSNKECGEKWITGINRRTGKEPTGCPYCNGGTKTSRKNSLGVLFPEISNQWDAEKNKHLGLTPFEIAPKSNRKVWWKCRNGYEWEAKIINRTNGFENCPCCEEFKKEKKYHNLKTHEQFEKEVYELVGDEYTLIGKYTRGKDRLEFKHNVCGQHCFISPDKFIQGSRCQSCVNKQKGSYHKLSQKDFVSRINESLGEDYEVLGKYVNYSTPIKMKHKTCGYEYEVIPGSALGNKNRKGTGCPKCYGTPKRTQDEVVKLVEEVGEGRFDLISEYQGHSSNVRLKHRDCQREFDVLFSSFINNPNCKHCYKESYARSKQKTHEQFVEEVFNLVGNEYEVLSEYKSSKEKVEIKHTKCGYINDFIASNFLNGGRCPKCQKVVRKDTSYFNEELLEIFDGEYRAISEYEGSYNEIRILHTTCGEEFTTKPSLLLNGSKCPYCYKGQNITQEVFERKIEKRYGNEYSVLGKYTGKDNYIRVRHNVCGTEYDTIAGNFSNGSQCLKCQNKQRMTTEEFKEELRSLVGDEFTVESEYKGRDYFINLKHEKCGFVFDTKPGYFINTLSCPYCEGRRVKKGFNDLATTHPLIASQWDYEKNEGICPQDITSSFGSKRLYWKCEKGHRWDNRLQDEIKRIERKKGAKCMYCAKKRASEDYNLKTEFPELIKEWNYDKNQTTPEQHLPTTAKKVWWKCQNPDCHHEWKVEIRDRAIGGSRCPQCGQNDSKGVVKIFNFLKENGINFKREQSFEDCRDIKKLRFDFGIKCPEGSVVGLIEYDGKQHFEPIEYFKGEEGFESLQRRDQIKVDYCQANNLPLLRIPYWDFDRIEQLVDGFLKQLNLL